MKKSGIQEKVKGIVKVGVFIAVGNGYNCLQGEMKPLESCPRLAEVESRLSKYTYLSRNNLPGYPDGIIFQMLNSSGSFPDRKRNPNFYHWYILMRQFASSTIQKWISDQLYYDSEDTLPSLFLAPDPSPDPPAPSSPNPQPKSPTQPEYIIEILLKESNPNVLEQLLRNLQPYDLSVETQQERQIRINCRGSSAQYQEIADLVGRTIEFQSLQVKKEKKMRPPQWENSPNSLRRQ